MLKITFIDHEGLHCPVILCAQCDQPISDGWGLIGWKDYATPDLIALHKRECCWAYEAVHGRVGPWLEINQFLSQLATNTESAGDLPIARTPKTVNPQSSTITTEETTK